jgi:hypothetical protein
MTFSKKYLAAFPILPDNTQLWWGFALANQLLREALPAELQACLSKKVLHTPRYVYAH